MSISIYYTARRERPLTQNEEVSISGLLDAYSVEEKIKERERTRKGPNWSSFFVYDSASPSEPGVIFEGATQLPDNRAKNLWIGVQHWCALLTEIRRVLPDADWDVHIDDHDICWDNAHQEFDPSS
jgi:hypothetical protein